MGLACHLQHSQSGRELGNLFGEKRAEKSSGVRLIVAPQKVKLAGEYLKAETLHNYPGPLGRRNVVRSVRHKIYST